MLRVSGGKYRGRNLDVPSFGTVPTKARVREAMMSICAPAIDGGMVLDLFAGSGALGIEALSRGAKHCVFVDADKKVCTVISKNLSLLKDNNARVMNMPATSALRSLSGAKFDLVFLDPPYAKKELYQESIDLLLKLDMLNPGCIVLVEYEGTLDLDGSPFAFRRDYTYGMTKLIQLRK